MAKRRVQSGAGFRLHRGIRRGVVATTILGLGLFQAVSVVPASAAPGTHLGYGSQPSNSTGGVAFASQPQVQALDLLGKVDGTDSSTVIQLTLKDGSGNPVSNGATLSCDQGTKVLPNSTTMSAGTATFSGCAVDGTGSYKILATATNNPTLGSVLSNLFTITLGPVAGFAISFASPSVTAGQSDNAVVTATDAGGNPEPGFRDTVVISSSDPQATAAGTQVPANYTYTAPDNGVHTFAIVFGTVGNQTITVTDQPHPATSATSNPAVSVSAGPFDHIDVTPATATIAAGGSQGYHVSTRDSSDNQLADVTSSATVTIDSGKCTAPIGPTQPWTCTSTTAGNRTVTATYTSGSTYHATATLTVTPDVAAGLAFSNPPYTFVTGNPSFESNSNGVDGWNTGSEQTASDCATQTPAPPAPSSSSTQHHTGALSVVLGGEPTPGQPAEPCGNSHISQPVHIPANANTVPTALEFWYYPVTSDSGTHDWQEAQVRASNGTTVLAQVFQNKPASGSAAWTRVRYDLSSFHGQDVVLWFNVHEDGESGPADPTSMYLDDVSIVQQAGTGGTSVLTPQPSVHVVDKYGNNVGGDNTTQVRLALASGPGGAVAYCAGNPVTAVNGVVTFSGCSVTAGGQDFVLKASDVTPSRTQPFGDALSAPFDLAPAPATIALTGVPANSTAGVQFTVTVTLKDGNGATVPGYTGTVHFSSTDPQATLPADYHYVAGDAGTRSFPVVLKTAGSKGVTVTDTRDATLTRTVNSTVAPGSVDHITLSPGATSIAAGNFQVYAADAHDAFGNDLGDVTSSTTFGVTPDGTCTFSFCEVGKAGPHTVTGTYSGKQATSLLYVTPSGYVLDGYGGLHQYGGAPQYADSTHAYWQGWDIARGVTVRADGRSGYTLDGWGGIHTFGGATPISDGSHAYWQGWDIARGIALDPTDATGSRGYVLDGWGGIHAFGGALAVPDNTHAYWQGWDIARALVVTGNGKGYVLDGWGGVHAFGAATPVLDNTHAYWHGWDIARSLVVTADGQGYILDGYGGVHQFGGLPNPHVTGYRSGSDTFRSLTYVGTLDGGYVLDAFGNLFPYSTDLTVPAVAPSATWPGWDIARRIGSAG